MKDGKCFSKILFILSKASIVDSVTLKSRRMPRWNDLSTLG